MKRLHVNLGVDDVTASVNFYTQLFNAEPSVLKDDYARWMLDDPRVNFAISRRSGKSGIDHLGIQTEDKDELDEVYSRLERAGGATLDEGETTCCYSRSTKRWIKDPQGVAWETFLTHGDSDTFGQERQAAKPAAPSSGCC